MSIGRFNSRNGILCFTRPRYTLSDHDVEQGSLRINQRLPRLQRWGAAQEVREEGFGRSQVGLAFATRLVQHEMWFNKWIICFYPTAGIGLDYTGRALKASGGLLLLIVLKGNKNIFTSIDGADGLLIAIRRAGHCRVEVRSKGMKNKRKNTQ
jgi:hypothetical protein